MPHLNPFKIGDIVMAQWQDDNQWYQATILQNTTQPDRYLVHFDGYNADDILLNYPENLIIKSEYDKHMNEICMHTKDGDKNIFKTNDEIMALYSFDGHLYPGYILIMAPNKVYVIYDAWYHCEWLNYSEILTISTYNKMNKINVNNELFVSRQMQKYKDNAFNITSLLNRNKSYLSSQTKIAVLNKMYMDEIPAFRDQFSTPLYWISSRLRNSVNNWNGKEAVNLSLVISEMEKLIQNGAVLYVEYNVENTNDLVYEIPGYTGLSLKHLMNIYFDLKNNNIYFHINEAEIINMIHRLLHAMHGNDVNKIEYHQDTKKTVIYDIKNTAICLKPNDLYWDVDGKQQPLSSLSDGLIIELFWNGVLYDDYGCYWWLEGGSYSRLKRLYQFTYDTYLNELIKIFKQLKLIDILKDIVQIIFDNLLDATLC